MNCIKKLLGIFVFIITGTCIGQQKIKIDGVAAVVGDHIVLESDIEKFKQELQVRNSDIEISDCEIMEQVMQQKLFAHQAVVDSVAVTNAEVEGNVSKTLEHFKSQLGNMSKVVELYGFDDVEDLRTELTRIEKENLLTNREKQSVVQDITVTPEEIRFFYNDLTKQKQLPNYGVEVELAQITISAKPTEKAVEEVLNKLKGIKKDIEGGYSMRLKAILYSEDPGVAQNGGQYTITRQSQFVKEFKEAAFSLEEGEVSDPFKSQFGYHILQVEKIRGQQRVVRHILMQPKVEEEKLGSAREKLESVRAQIIAKEITFDQAVNKYSDDEATKLNKGVLSNPYSGDSKFELNKMDPKLFAKIDQLNEGDMTQVFFEETRDGEKMYKIILIKNKIESHQANLQQDYEKIQQLALQKKQQETIDDWSNDKIKDTYVKVSNNFKSCGFKYNWSKN